MKQVRGAVVFSLLFLMNDVAFAMEVPQTIVQVAQNESWMPEDKDLDDFGTLMVVVGTIAVITYLTEKNEAVTDAQQQLRNMCDQQDDEEEDSSCTIL